MLRIACGALAGVCCILVLPRLPTPVEGAVAAVSLAALGSALRSRSILAFVAAATLAQLDARARLDDWLARELEAQKISITGVVCSVPQAREQGVRFRFAIDPQPRMRLPRIVELNWYDVEPAPRAAERWSLEVKLRRPRGFANPGGADLAARLLRDRIGATGYVHSGERLAVRRGDLLRWPVLRLRAQVADAIRNAVGARPATGIIVGLAVGLQDALTAEQWRELSRSGTSHLMAISGLHIGMVAAVFAWLAARWWRHRQRRGALGTTRDAAAIAGTTAALAYSALAGASVPTQRTAIMIGVAAVALVRRRNTGVVDGLSGAMFVVLAIDPLAPLAPGFWLSFGAVAAIAAAMGGYVARPGLAAAYLRTQLAVTVGLVPVLCSAFGGVSIVSAAVNLPAIPLYTLIVVPWVLCGSAAAVLDPGLGGLLLRPVAWLIETTWPLIATPAGWSLSTWSVAAPGAAGWVLMSLGVVAALAPLNALARCAGAVTVAIVCAWQPPAPKYASVRAAVLDVGQGLAVVVQTRHHALVYDTGPAFRSGSDAGQLVVAPYLRSRGVRRIDTLVVSHDDGDHAGGAISLLDAMPVGARIASGHALDRSGDVEPCRRGGRWTWDGVAFAWLNGGPEPGMRDNDRSCVLLVDAAGRRVLLPGDIEALAEARLLADPRLSAVDVVVVPHHGSRSSSTSDFVARTSPAWAVVSAGYRNRWGFPRPEVVSRWQAAGAAVIETADSGAIEFELGAGRIDGPHAYRLERRRFWQEP